MRVFYAIGLLLLINDQVNSLPTTLGEEDTLDDLHSWIMQTGLESYQQEIKLLQILKKAGVGEFLKCDRLIKGMENIGEMFQQTYNITLDVGQLVKDVATGLAACSAGSPWLAPVCVAKYIWDFGNTLQKQIPVYELYKLDMKRLASEINEIYNYCTTAK